MNVIGDDGVCRVYNYAKIGKRYVALTEGCRFEHLFFRVQGVNGSTIRYESPKAYYRKKNDEADKRDNKDKKDNKDKNSFMEKKNNYNLLARWKSRRDKVITDFFQQDFATADVDVSFELKN